MPRVRDQSIDRQIDEWSGGGHPVAIKEVHPSCKFDISEDNCTMICTLVYAVVYQLVSGYKKEVMAKPGKLPLWARGTPCIDAMDGVTGRPITVMAGIFGVPEGAPLTADDNEPAPKPMMSPDFLLLQYSDLFKPNSGEGDSDERNEEPLYAGGERKIPLPAGS